MRYEPEVNLNKGPGFTPRWAKYGSMAETGHTMSEVFPTAKVTPSGNGSVLEALSLMYSVLVCLWWSRLISPTHRVGSNRVGDGQQILPDRKKPKKHKFMAAQSIMLFGLSYRVGTAGRRIACEGYPG